MTGASEDSRDASSTAPEGVLEPGARFCVGNQTAFSARNEMDPFHFALAHGFEAFEWFSDRKGDHGIAWQQLSPELRRRIREQATKCSLLQAVHAPWQASVLREDGRTALRESIDFARDIGASTVVVHLEAHYSASYASALTEVARYADRKSVV